MDNHITQLLGIKDDGIKVLQIKDTAKTKTITIERIPTLHFCPHCKCRMYSKGIYTRKVNHPILQGGVRLILEVRQRRWQCQNSACKHIETDEFSFVNKYRRNTNTSDFLIIDAFRNPLSSAKEIARRFNVSDTHAIQTFARYVDMPRRQLTAAICIDEVYTNISHDYKYALVIQDFYCGEPLDLLKSRRKNITEPYFLNIPVKERKRVKYLITDMYKTYQDYCGTYFPNAVNVVDAFHVIKTINSEFLKYIRKDIRMLDERDRKLHEQREQQFHRHLQFSHSKDYLVLKKFHALLLKNADNIKYYTQPKYNHVLCRQMTTYDYFEWMYRIDPDLEKLRELKEEYIKFNSKYAGNPKGARKALPDLISLYSNCEYTMFHNIADMLRSNFEAIINSFIILEKSNGDKVRLSNGPIESINRIVKDIKRIGRGYRNFELLRNRFLFSQRKNAAILGAPKKLEDTYLHIFKQPYTETLYEDEDYDYDEDEWLELDL